VTVPADDYRAVTREELPAILAGNRDFDGVVFAADLMLDDFDFAEARFTRCQFRAPTLRGADFSSSVFEECRFEPMRWANCKLTRARLQGCTLFDIGTRKGCTFAFCDLEAAEVARSNFATGAFERCDLYGFSAVDSSFRGAQFKQSSFTKTLSRRSALTKVTFERCNLSFADLSGLFLQKAEFLSCKLSEASFVDTDLGEATLRGCSLDRVEWERARLGKADLRGSELSGLSLVVLADHAGVMISDSEQAEILRQLGVDVHPS
jgi:fluoroquinolone resistance protein